MEPRILPARCRCRGDGRLVAFCFQFAATAKTVARIKAPSNQRVKVLGYGFYFDGTLNPAQPVQIQVGRITADGTFTAATPLPNGEELTETFQTVRPAWLMTSSPAVPLPSRPFPSEPACP